MTKNSFSYFYIKFRVQKHRLLAFPEVLEAGRKHFHLSWYMSVPVVTSYGQKPWGELFRPRTVWATEKTWKSSENPRTTNKNLRKTYDKLGKGKNTCILYVFFVFCSGFPLSNLGNNVLFYSVFAFQVFLLLTWGSVNFECHGRELAGNKIRFFVFSCRVMVYTRRQNSSVKPEFLRPKFLYKILKISYTFPY